MRYKIDIFYMYVDILLDTLYILDIILNNSHWDDLVPATLLLVKKPVQEGHCVFKNEGYFVANFVLNNPI